MKNPPCIDVQPGSSISRASIGLIDDSMIHGPAAADMKRRAVKPFFKERIKHAERETKLCHIVEE